MIWTRSVSLDELNQRCRNTLIDHLGIQFSALGAETLEATMPVARFTHQPFGLLHGGASVALAESLGSMASWLCCPPGVCVVGTDINASHLRAVSQGLVTGVCRPARLGGVSHVWQIELFNERREICCTARLTTLLLGADKNITVDYK